MTRVMLDVSTAPNTMTDNVARMTARPPGNEDPLYSAQPQRRRPVPAYYFKPFILNASARETRTATKKRK
jgi:hypothetical protein